MRQLMLAAFILGLITTSFYIGYTRNRLRPHAIDLGSAEISLPVAGADGSPIILSVTNRETPLLLLIMSADCGYCRENFPNWVTLNRIANAHLVD